MCGIVASSISDCKNEVFTREMLKKIKHRGPDNTDFFSNPNVSLGSCRLSIMDISKKADMPMTDRSGRFVIVYNGEVYNFKDLKKKYEISTRTNSDTEVVLELYAKLKENCLNELNGIFSFIIFDKHNNNWIGKKQIKEAVKFYGKRDYSNYLLKLI